MDHQEILDRVSASYQNILADNLVGIYVHGSIAFGCFHPKKSDIDYIVVIRDPLSQETKRSLMDATVEINASTLSKGLEMSVVLGQYCMEFEYPTPFELHFSNAQMTWYLQAPDDYCVRMNGKDKDLAAHFTIIRHNGIVLYGEPVSDVFGEVPAAFYLDSIRSDVRNAGSCICEDPVYVVLNLCRVAAYVRQGMILSKKQGGEWGREHLPREFEPVLSRALKSYQTGEDMCIGKDEADRFCEYMLNTLTNTY